jgi:hypothetical protein
MGLRVNSRVDDVAFAVAKAINDTRRALVAANPHADATPELTSGDYKNPSNTIAAVGAATPTTEATLIVICKEIQVIYALHMADAHAHKVADTVDVVATSALANEAACWTFLNLVKAAYNLHRASTTYHYTADATFVVAAADATDAATGYALATEIKADLNSHIAAALGGSSVRINGVH